MHSSLRDRRWRTPGELTIGQEKMYRARDSSVGDELLGSTCLPFASMEAGLRIDACSSEAIDESGASLTAASRNPMSSGS